MLVLDINNRIIELRDIIDNLQKANFDIKKEKDSVLSLESDSKQMNIKSTNLISEISGAINCKGISINSQEESDYAYYYYD